MEPAFQDHSCTLNTWKSIPKMAGFITVYLVAVCNPKFIAVCTLQRFTSLVHPYYIFRDVLWIFSHPLVVYDYQMYLTTFTLHLCYIYQSWWLQQFRCNLDYIPTFMRTNSLSCTLNVLTSTPQLKRCNLKLYASLLQLKKHLHLSYNWRDVVWQFIHLQYNWRDVL